MFAAAIAMSAVVLVWSLAGALAQRAPELALRLWPGEPLAATAAAGASLRRHQETAAAAYARTALRGDPLHVRSLALLGMAADRNGELRRAQRDFDEAFTLSRGDVLTDAWLLHRSLLDQRLGQAIAAADALLRVDEDPSMDGAVFRVIALASGDSRGLRTLDERLALRPPWRAAFFNFLNGAAVFDDVEGPILIGLAKTAPASPAEYAPYVLRLVDQARYLQAAEAYDDIRGAARVPRVRDSRFAGAPDGTPFSWSAVDGPGAMASEQVSLRRSPSRWLRVDWDGYSTPQLPGQLLTLAPGTYQLAWLERGRGAHGSLVWTLACVGAPARAPLGVSAESPAPSWRPGELSVTVPDGCPAQWLRLTARPGDRVSEVTRWYASMRLTPAT